MGYTSMVALIQSYRGSTYPFPCWLKLCSAMLGHPICKHLPLAFSLPSDPHAQSLRSRHDCVFPLSPNNSNKERASPTLRYGVCSVRSHMQELTNRMAATSTRLYARIPTNMERLPLLFLTFLLSFSRSASLKSRPVSFLFPF